MKEGVFGGTFNPVHNGHLNAAFKVSEILGLDEIVFIPVYKPPHKVSADLVSSEERIKMLNLALENMETFHVSDIEIQRKGKSYTIDTLEYLKRETGSESVFIMGSDSFLSFKKWHRWKDILKISELAVVHRPGYSWNNSENIVLELGYQPAESGVFFHKIYKTIYFVEIEGVDASSTKIRELIKKNRSADLFLNKKVAEYINKKGLYK